MPIPQFNQEKFNSLVLDNTVIRFLPKLIEVADGRLSHIDIIWQPLFENLETRNQIADQVISFVNNLGFMPDVFKAASPDTELLAATIQEKWNMLRARTDAQMPDHPKAIVIHDTTILGRIVMGGVENARKDGALVIGAVSLIDRNELRNEKRTAAQFIASYGIPYYPMSGLIGLLPEALARHEPDGETSSKEALIRAIELYFKQYGTEHIKLS